MKNKRFLTGILGIVLVAGLCFTGCNLFDDLFSKGKDNGTDSYTVTFSANGATSGNVPPEQTVDEGSSIPIPPQGSLLKTGYTFGGWNTTSDGSGTNYSAGSSFDVTEDTTLYAKWNPIQVTISFNNNGGTGTVSPITANAGSSITLPQGTALSKTGYTFGGWKTDSETETPLYAEGQAFTVNTNTTLYAHWLANSLPTYTVTYNANGATSGQAPVQQQATQGAGILVQGHGNLTNTGKTFSMWNTQSNGLGTGYTAGASLTVTGNITLYAQWIDITLPTFSVTYNANGGGGTVPGTQTVNQGTTISVAAKGGLVDKQYNTFGGWNTSANGSGTSYAAGASLTVTENIVLYAQWNPIQVTISFNNNGGTGTVSPITANAGSNITLPQGTSLSKTGFTFGGWNTNTAGTGTNYIAGAQYTPTINTTLYAKWTAVSTGGNFNDITAAQWVAAVKAGWNLGNTLDATSGFEWNMPNPSVAAMEGGWGNPVTTKANITALKNAGFNGIRIPVSWIKAADSNFNIRADWMNRVKEVANYAVENDMYIIINTHHDSGEGYFKLANNSQISNFSKIWTQIANAFKDYNEKLIFESLNEPRTVGGSMEWNGGTSTEHAILNQYHQAFVTAVRATGGNNAKRCLLINAYAASGTSTAANGLVLPTDSAANKLIVSYHSYTPNNFCFGGSTTTWNNDRSAFTSPMDIFKTKFVNNGIPVIIGEFGANNKNNETERARWAAAYVEEAGQRGMPCFWWDTGKTDTAFNTGEDSGYAILNRSTNAFYYSAIVTALTNVTVTTPPPVDPPPSGTTIITLPKNQYGDGYQLQYNPLPSGSTITSGSTYTFTYSFKSDIRVDNLQIVLIDGSEPDAFWRLLSGWTNFGNIAANTVVSGTRTITATGTASSSEAKANVLVFDAAQSTGSPPTLTFTTFDFKKN